MAGVVYGLAAPLVAEGVRYVVDQITGRNKKRKITDYYRSAKKPRSVPNSRSYRVTSDPRGLEMAKTKAQARSRSRAVKRARRSYTTGHGEVAVVGNSNKFTGKRRRSKKAKLIYKVDEFNGHLLESPIGQWSPFAINHSLGSTDLENIFTDSQYINMVAGNVSSNATQMARYFRNAAYSGYTNSAFGGSNYQFLSDVPVIGNVTSLEITNTSTVTGLFEVWQIMPKLDIAIADLVSTFSSSATLQDQLANYNFEPNAGIGVASPLEQPTMQDINFDFARLPVFKKSFDVVDMKSMWISPGEMSLCKFDAVKPHLKSLDILRRLENYPSNILDGAPQNVAQVDILKGISTIYLLRCRGRVTVVDTIGPPIASAASYSRCSFAVMFRHQFTCGMPVGDRVQKKATMFGHYVNNLPLTSVSATQTDQMNAEVDAISAYATLN